MDSLGNVLRSYTWGAAGLISDTGAKDEGIRPRFYFFDALGNTRHLRKTNGTVHQTAYWQPDGATVIHPDTPFGIQGKEGRYADAESGLVYMRHRNTQARSAVSSRETLSVEETPAEASESEVPFPGHGML